MLSVYRCRVQGITFYAALVVPLAMLIVFNLTVFFAVTYKLSKNPILSISSQNKRFRLRTFVGLTMLLGLTWTIGLILIGSSHIILQWAFTLLVTTQGFFIFLLQVATHKLVRRRLSTFRSTMKLRFVAEKTNLSLSRADTWKVFHTYTSTKTAHLHRVYDYAIPLAPSNVPASPVVPKTVDHTLLYEVSDRAPPLPPRLNDSQVTTCTGQQTISIPLQQIITEEGMILMESAC